MRLKVQCPCGTRFVFDVEPVGGCMPTPVACPSCGADATALANAAIAEQQGAVPAASAAEPSGAAADSPAEQPTGRLRVRVATPPAVPAQPAGESAGQLGPCPHHPAELAVEHCGVCGKPICRRCMELHGYTCSVLCRARAEREQIPLPHSEQQRHVARQSARRRHRALAWSVAALAAALLGVWAWWNLVGSRPRVVFTLPLSAQARGTSCELLGPTEVLILQERRVALVDLGSGRERWAVPVEAPVQVVRPVPPATRPVTPARAAEVAPLRADSPLTGLLDDTESEFDQQDGAAVAEGGLPGVSGPRLLRAGQELWLLLPDRIVALDRQTGQRRRDIPLPPPLTAFSQHDAAVAAVTGASQQVRTVTRVSLPEGAVTTIQLPLAGPPGSVGAGVRASAGTRPRATALPTAEDAPLQEEFIAAGPNIVHMQTRLLERRVVRRPAGQPAGGASLLESGRLSAGRSLDAARELLAEMRGSDGGGMVDEDSSRYRVTLSRLCGEAAPDWTGEIIGPPRLAALRTVDVLLGGREFIVFSKANTKRWAAKLTYPISWGWTPGRPPCAESADALYVFDEGMLTCFELASGQVRWRFTSGGISRVQLDGGGKVYVTAHATEPAQADLPQAVNLLKRPRPVLLQLDPASGKVLWQLTDKADTCILAGRFVYAARSSSGLLSPGAYFNLYRLDPASGRELWHYHADRWPRQTGYYDNSFLLQWPEAAQVFRFSTL